MKLSRFIITVTPELLKSALEELRTVSPGLEQARSFKNGVYLVETDMPGKEFTANLVGSNPVFIKHIMPVQAEFPLSMSKDADLPSILDNIKKIATFSEEEGFSVQCRRVGGDYDYDSKDVEVFVGSYYESAGAVPRFSDTRVAADPDLKVISLYLFKDTGYAGFSTVLENLNEHCDEYRIFSRLPRGISRAEYKLVEALRKFRIELPGGRALDLGAAPGGWTKVLADSGMQVTAIDPAELHEKAVYHPNVTHARVRAEDFIADGEYDLLVNDMNMDPEDSAGIMMQLAGYLKTGAPVIMTVKLVIRQPVKLISNVKTILEPAFEIMDIRNLFHNRMEVTVLLRKR